MHTRGSNAAAFLEAAYDERIDFLQNLGRSASRPLAIVQARLPMLPEGSRDILMEMARRDAVISLAAEEPVASLDESVFPTDPLLRKTLDTLEGSPHRRRSLPGANVGTLFSVEGTADCSYEWPYRLEGGRAFGVAAPEVWRATDCWTVWHELARIGGDVTAVRVDATGADQTLLMASPWSGQVFEPKVSLLVRFDRQLVVKESACAPAEHPCDAFAAIALDVARRHDTRPLPGTLDTPLSAEQAKAWQPLLEVSRRPPDFSQGGDSYRSMSGMGVKGGGWEFTEFGDEAVFFPVVFRGDVLLGRIGHGHLGWRISPSWNVATWRLNHGVLEPVASAYIAVVPGRVLLAAPLSSPVLPKH
jgi:hypothetical protein